jgi:hypothetical protein
MAVAVLGDPGSAGGARAEAVFAGVGTMPGERGSIVRARSGASGVGAVLSRASLGYDRLRGTPLFGLAAYKTRETELEQAYAKLSFADAIRVRGAFRLIPVLVSCGWLIYLIFRQGPDVLSALAGLVLRAAYAAQPAEAASTFTPPLGLPQSIFNIIVLVFVGAAVCIIGVLLYAGFIAKTKNVKAAALVEHMCGFIVGVLFGSKLPS